ncbi:hypothetical protein [Gordonia sp. MP11Mi]|uniref:Uncharacterized protein n=1 Tax=Gordonia sp. MP11Mi TaxID=3022769 RepID=A0AA97CZQ8_9ACTN
MTAHPDKFAETLHRLDELGAIPPKGSPEDLASEAALDALIDRKTPDRRPQ